LKFLIFRRHRSNSVTLRPLSYSPQRLRVRALSTHIRRSKRNGDLLPSKFTAFHDERQIVTASRTPFCDGARALLADGTAQSSDMLIMRHAGSQVDALKAPAGVAARLTVSESNGPPEFRPLKPLQSIAGKAPMLEPGDEATTLASQ
jgi:hypothetical protein